jgi:transcriptional regulator with XRE-family HTH domain
MTASPDLGPWLRQQREQRSWSRNEMARRLINVAQVSGDTAMPAAEDVATNIYRWERGTVTPSDRYRLYYCHTLGIPPDRFGDPEYDPAQDTPRVIITISLPEGTDARLRLTSLDTPSGPGTWADS